MTICDDLRQSVLQAAIQGKLTKQLPEDGTAGDLLFKIKAEELAGDKPFDIPDNWVWVSHNVLFKISGGSQPPKSQFVFVPKDGFVRLYQTRDYGNSPQPVYIPEKTATKQSKKGDIILARYGGSLGKVFWAENGAYNVALAKVIINFPSCVSNQYAYI